MLIVIAPAFSAASRAFANFCCLERFRQEVLPVSSGRLIAFGFSERPSTSPSFALSFGCDFFDCLWGVNVGADEDGSAVDSADTFDTEEPLLKFPSNPCAARASEASSLPLFVAILRARSSAGTSLTMRRMSGDWPEYLRMLDTGGEPQLLIRATADGFKFGRDGVKAPPTHEQRKTQSFAHGRC